MEPSWELVGAFLQVMRTGSLSGASRTLNLAQPTVRRRVEALEDQLGTPLFTRSQNGLVPTDAARAMLPHAEVMEAAARTLVRVAGSEADVVAGTVRITTSRLMGTEVLPGLLAPLRTEHPALQVELALSDHNDDLIRRDADVAVRMARPQGSGLVARRATTIELGFFASPTYLGTRLAPQRPEQLGDHDLVGYDRNPRLVEALVDAGLPLAAADFAVRTDDDPAMIACLRAGLGIGVCQAPLARRYGLVRVLPQLGFGLEAWVVAHEDLRGVRRIRAVIEHLAAALAAYAG